MYKIAKSLLIICLIELISSCDINDSYADCVRYTDISLKFEYFANNKDKTNVISQFLTEGVLYVYDNSTGALVNTDKVSKEELENGKQLRLKNGNYKFICWGNQLTKSQVIKKENFNTAKISAPEFTENKKIPTNDQLYYTSKVIEVGSLEKKTTSDSKQVIDTLTFNSAHINFLVRVHGLKKHKNLKLEVSNLMPQYDFNMKPAAPFETTYYPTLTSQKQEKGEDIRQFLFSVLRFNNNNKIVVKLSNADGNEPFVKEVKLQDYLKNNNIDVEKKQEVNIIIDYKETTVGIIVNVEEWSEIPTIPIN